MRKLLFPGFSLLLVAAMCATARATPVPFVDAAPGITSFTAPQTGTYDILAFGGQGGTTLLNNSVGGLGAEIGGEFVLTAGETLTVAVGGRGGDGIVVPIYCGGGGPPCGFNYGGGAGGGGSFVVGPNNTPLVVAGGGGGAGGPGQTSTSGQGAAVGLGTLVGGGVNGSGGQSLGVGGGGGFYSAGASGGAGYPTLTGSSGFGSLGGNGGFGGGAGGGAGGVQAGGHTSAGGGGGGGYSGGAGGTNTSGGGSGGGGGGSFDAGLVDANLVLVAGVNSGDGSVTITELSSAPIPEPTSLAILVSGFAGILAWRRR